MSAAMNQIHVRPIDALAQAPPAICRIYLEARVPPWFVGQALRIVDWALSHPGEALPIPSRWRDTATRSPGSHVRVLLNVTRHLGIPTTYGEIPAELTAPRWT